MKNSIKYRSFKESDLPYLISLTKKIWEYDKYLSENSASFTSELDLLCYLKSQTFIEIAENNNVPIGFIMAKNVNDVESSKYDKRISTLKKQIFLRPDGLLIFLFRHKIKNINKYLFSQVYDNKYTVEIIFFAVDETYRGLGIGKRLFNDFKNRFLKNEKSKFYLYTDTTCNYKFYDYLGLRRSASKKLKLPFSKSFQEFYIYDNII